MIYLKLIVTLNFSCFEQKSTEKEINKSELPCTSKSAHQNSLLEQDPSFKTLKAIIGLEVTGKECAALIENHFNTLKRTMVCQIIMYIQFNKTKMEPFGLTLRIE